MKKLAILGVLTLAVAALTVPVAAAPATQEIVLVDQYVINDCNGEFVHLVGNLHLVTKVTEDGAGGFHILSRVNRQGMSGVGLTTGAKYQASGGNNLIFNYKVEPPFPYEWTNVVKYNLIGQGKVDDLTMHSTVHITVNANGEVTSEVEVERLSCR